MLHILYIHICVCVCLEGGCIYVYCSSPYLYIVNTKLLMGFLLSLKIRKNKQEWGGGGGGGGGGGRGGRG